MSREEEFCRLYRAERITNQLQWYRDRSLEYRSAHDQAVVLRNVLLWAAAVCGVIGATPVGGPARTALGLGAALLAALATVVTQFETLIDFDALRKLYDDAADNLEQADLDWDAAHAQDVPAIVDRVEDALQNENGRWGQLLQASATVTGESSSGADRSQTGPSTT